MMACCGQKTAPVTGGACPRCMKFRSAATTTVRCPYCKLFFVPVVK